MFGPSKNKVAYQFSNAANTYAMLNSTAVSSPSEINETTHGRKIKQPYKSLQDQGQLWIQEPTFWLPSLTIFALLYIAFSAYRETTVQQSS